MFRINQIERQKIYQSSTLSHGEEGEENNWEVTFGNGIKKTYHKDELTFWPYFQNMIFGSHFKESSDKKVNLALVDIEIFELLGAIFRRNIHLTTLLKDHPLQYDPYIYERLKEAYQYLCPESESKFDDVVAPMLTHYDFQQLQKTLLTFGQMCESEEAPQEAPQVVERLKRLECRKIFFESEADFETFHNKYCEYNLEIWTLENQIEQLKVQLSRSLSSSTFHFVEIQMNSKMQLIEVLKKERKELSEFKMPAISRAAEFQKSDDPLIKELASDAQERIDKYSGMILTALEKSGADMSRKDLLECLVGPKAYLLDYYGLVLDDLKRSKRFPFRYKEKSLKHIFGYELNNPSPAYLEKEMRTDLQRHLSEPLPPPILEYENRVVVSPQAGKLREEVLPILSKWELASQEDREAVLTKIIAFNDWDKFKFSPENMEIEPPTTFAPEHIKGSTVAGAHFKFDTYSFLIFIRPFSSMHFRSHVESTEMVRDFLQPQGLFLPFLHFNDNPDSDDETDLDELEEEMLDEI